MELSEKILSAFIVWNVGQGQWTTQIDSFSCKHFDAGGEVFPKDRIKELCSGKLNEIYISHWDFDHFNGLEIVQELGSKICRGNSAAVPDRKIPGWFRKLSVCDSRDIRTYHASLIKNYNQKNISKNDSSIVRHFAEVLIPGDSPISMEKTWIPQIKGNIKVLILGHHGAKNSTSALLMKKLKSLKMAVSSARYKVYGHPHAKTAARLKKNKVVLLRTEDWGNIVFNDEPPLMNGSLKN